MNPVATPYDAYSYVPKIRASNEAQEADKVEIAPEMTVASLRRFRAALLELTQGFPKRRRLCL